MRFAICNELFEGWEWPRVCDAVRSAEYEALEAAPYTLGASIEELRPAALETLRRQAADAGLQILGLHWLLAKTDGLYLTVAVVPAANAAVVAAAGSPRDSSFTIQIAASTNARYARAMVTELKDAGHAAYLVEPDAAAATRSYHVRIGRFSTLEEANRAVRNLEKTLGWRLSVTEMPLHAAARAKAAGDNR